MIYEGLMDIELKSFRVNINFHFDRRFADFLF